MSNSSIWPIDGTLSDATTPTWEWWQFKGTPHSPKFEYYWSFTIRLFNVIVVYWPLTPPNMLFQRRRKCIFYWRGRAWLTIWDRVKIPWYSRRLMHRKRVTCELHDSYFCSMTIKHAIPKMAEVHKILSGRLNYYITWWKQEVRLVWRPDQFGDKMW